MGGSRSITLGAIALGAAVLVGFGLWIGRSSTESSASAASDSVVAPSVVTESPPAAIRRPELPVKKVAPGVAADLVHADPKIRRATVRELDDPQLLLEAARDGDLEVAMVATVALGKLHAEGRVSAKDLIARVKDRGAHERVRNAALNGLGQVPSPEAAATLVELIARGDVVERRSAAALLSNQDTALAVPALIAALGDADEYVRAQAVDSLKARSRGRDFGTDAAAWRAWWDVESRR